MAFSFLKKIFGSGTAAKAAAMPEIVEDAPAVESDCGSGAPSAECLEKIQGFVKYVVCALVDQPEQVRLESLAKGDLNVIQIHCFKRDIGKIIGKSGKTIAALRLLVSGSAARLGFRATVDVMDD